MLKTRSAVLFLAVWAGYSYSDSITPYYGYTGNAAASGLSWQMDNVFPTPPGLDVNAVIYNYTPIKNPEDDMKVHVQNENAVDGGYIFRETDDWSGKQGGIEIRKVIGLPNIPREYWGDGSIEIEGQGEVTDANVVYSYKVTPCYDPQFSPNCPGYEPPKVDIPVIDLSDLYDASQDENVKNAMKETDEDLYDKDDEERDDDKEKKEKEEEKDSRSRLEKALAAADTSAMFAEGFAQAAMLDAMNAAINMNTYTAVSIDGGTYKETVALDGGELPDNKAGRRMSMSSQILHDKMIDMQYNR